MDEKELYRERSRLIAFLASRFNCSLEPARDCEDDPDFNWVLYVDMPTGQVSWHIADWDLDLFDFVKRNEGRVWDGHDNDEKYKRIKTYISGNRLNTVYIPLDD
jgi:hypothetical protein